MKKVTKTSKTTTKTEASKKRGRPRKVALEAAPKKKISTKKIVVKKARNSIKKNTSKMTLKKGLERKCKSPSEKSNSNSNAKIIMNQAKKLFGEAKKSVSAFKKSTKLYGQLLTSALKTGDEKVIGRVNKLFGYIGYSLTADKASVTNTVSAKVRVPKVKIQKPTELKTSADKVEDKPKVKHTKKRHAQLNEEPKTAEPTNNDLEEVESEIKQPQVSDAEPSNEELAEIEKELEDDPLNDEESSSIEDEDIEFNTPSDDDRERYDPFEDSDLRDRSESDNEMFEAMRDNGDID